MKKKVFRGFAIILLALLARHFYSKSELPQVPKQKGENEIIWEKEFTNDFLDRYHKIDKTPPPELIDICRNYKLFPLRWSGLRSFDVGYDEYIISFADYLNIKDNLNKYYQYHTSIQDIWFNVENIYFDCGIPQYCQTRDRYDIPMSYIIQDDDEYDEPLFGGYPYVRSLRIECPEQDIIQPPKSWPAY